MGQRTILLQMKNYRRFAETGTIAFQPGLTIISGQNGAGKSTLIEAFLYTLFGPKPGPKARQRVDDIRTDSLNGPVSVECKVHIDDQEVHIVRSGTTAELRINSVVQVQSGSGSGRAVTGRVTALLGGLTREQFERTYIALQGDTAGLVEEKASERRAIIEKVLQLEVLTKAIELQAKNSDIKKGEVISLGKIICDALFLDIEARELIQSFQGARSANTRSQHTQRFLKRIEQSITEQQQRQKESAQEAAQAQTAARATAKKRQDHQDAIVGADQTYKQQEGQKVKYDECQEKIAFVQGHLEQSEKDIQKYLLDIEAAEQYAKEAAAYEHLQTEIGNCESRLKSLPLIKNCYNVYVQAQDEVRDLERQLREFATVDAELHLAQEQEEQARRHKERVENNDPTKADDEAWQRQSGGLEREEAQNREALKQLTDGMNGASCPTCHQILAEHTREQRIDHLTLWLNTTLPSLQEQLQQQKQRLDRRKAEWENEKKQAERAYNQCQTNVATIEKKIVKRDTLCEQHGKAQQAFSDKHNAWLALGEGVPDPQEDARIRSEKADLTEQAELLKDQADAYHQLRTHQKNLAEKQQEREKHLLDREGWLAQQRALGFDPESFQQVKDRLELLREQEKEVLELFYQAETTLNDAQLAERQIRMQVETTGGFHSRFGIGVREYMRGERLREHLEGFKKHFFTANTEQVMKRTSELLMYAITDQSILGVRFAGDDFQYLDASHMAYPVARLSGGEKSLVGLCLRIALAEQAQTIAKMGRVKFLVLDEVLSSLDEERTESVKRIFADVLQRGIFEHIIMITHLDTVKQSWHAHGLAVQKLDGKISTVISASPGEVHLDLAVE